MSEAQIVSVYWTLIIVATLVITILIHNLLHPYRRELCPMCGNIILRSELIGPHGECPTCVERKEICPLVERLRYSDRNKVASNLLAALGDPDSPQAKEFAEILHFTPQGWKEFAGLVLDSFRQQEIKLTEKQPRETKKATVTHPKTFRSQKPAKSTINDIYPSDIKDCGVNAQIMSKANGLIAVLRDLDPDHLSDRSRELLEELMILISYILEVKAS